MESPNIGHLGGAYFVRCKEVVLFGRFKMYWNYREQYVGVSTIVDSTVLTFPGT